MFGTGGNQDAVCRLADDFNESECQFQIGGRIENFWMGYDTQKTAKHQVGHSKRLVPDEELLEPESVRAVLRSILPMGVNEDVNIKELHS